MKKKISVILIIAIMTALICGQVLAFSDVETGKQGDAINNLSSLGILKGYEDGTFKPNNHITRAEFVAVVNRVLGISNFISGKTKEDLFIDVPKTHWAAGDIKYGVDSKIILGYGNGYFGPEDNVTYEQAFKMIFCAMGYKLVAETYGGYPAGFIQLAVINGITKGLDINYSADATRGNISVILYEAMQVETMERKTFGENEEIQKSGTTLLNELLKMKNADILEGIVIENQITGLYGDTNLSDGQVKIENLTKTEEWILSVGETNAAQLLGQRVEFQINKDEALGIPEIIKITPKKNAFIEIEADQIVNTLKSGNSFTVEYEEKDLIKKINLFDTPAVIYNGRRISEPSAEDLFIKSGKMKLISNNQNTKYNVVLLEEYYSFRIDKISMGTSVVFLKDADFYGMNRISLEPDEDDFYFTIQNKDGEALELADLKPDDVITVLSDKLNKNIKIIVSKDQVNGTIEEINDDGIIINGKNYKIAKDTTGSNMFTPDLTMEGIFYIDIYEQVVGFGEGETIVDNVGYILDKGIENSFDGKFIMKVLLGGTPESGYDDKTRKYYYKIGNTEIKTFLAAEKTRVDNVISSSESIHSKLNIGDLVNFSTNHEGLITNIDILTSYYSDEKADFNAEIGAFDGEFIIDNKTVVFGIPKNVAPKEEDYFVNVKLEDGQYDVAGYEIDQKTKVVKFAIIKSDMKADVPGIITSDADIMVVTNVYEKAVDDNNIYCILEGMQNGKMETLTVKSEAAVYTAVKELNKGDVIYYSKNSQDLVDNIEYIESLMPKPNYFFRDKREENKRLFGKLNGIVRDELRSTNNFQSEFVVNTAEGTDLSETTITVASKDMPPVYLLNTTTGKISVITLDDLYSTAEVGFDKATELFIGLKKNTVKAIIAIK